MARLLREDERVTETARTRDEMARAICRAFDVEPWVVGVDPMPRRPLRRWLRYQWRRAYWHAYYRLHPHELRYDRRWRQV